MSTSGISGKVSSKKNTFCIQYWKIGDSTNPKVMRRINSNGLVISAHKFSEVFFYANLREAWVDARWFQENGFDIKIKKCNKGRNDTFWLF
jgi:hypothetical protein